MKIYNAEKRLSKSVKKWASRIIKVHNKYKNSYFWRGHGNAKQRERRESDFQCEVMHLEDTHVKTKDGILRVQFHCSISRSNFRYSLEVFLDHEKKDIREIKKLLKQGKRKITRRLTIKGCSEWLNELYHSDVVNSLRPIMNKFYDEHYDIVINKGKQVLHNILENNNLFEVAKSAGIDDKRFENCLYESQKEFYEQYVEKLYHNKLYQWIDEHALLSVDIWKLKQTISKYDYAKKNNTVAFMNLNKVINIEKYKKFILNNILKNFSSFIYDKYNKNSTLDSSHVKVNVVLKEQCCSCNVMECINHSRNYSDLLYVLAILKNGIYVHRDCPYILELTILGQAI